MYDAGMIIEMGSTPIGGKPDRKGELSEGQKRLQTIAANIASQQQALQEAQVTHPDSPDWAAYDTLGNGAFLLGQDQGLFEVMISGKDPGLASRAFFRLKSRSGEGLTDVQRARLLDVIIESGDRRAAEAILEQDNVYVDELYGKIPMPNGEFPGDHGGRKAMLEKIARQSE